MYIACTCFRDGGKRLTGLTSGRSPTFGGEGFAAACHRRGMGRGRLFPRSPRRVARGRQAERTAERRRRGGARPPAPPALGRPPGGCRLRWKGRDAAVAAKACAQVRAWFLCWFFRLLAEKRLLSRFQGRMKTCGSRSLAREGGRDGGQAWAGGTSGSTGAGPSPTSSRGTRRAAAPGEAALGEPGALRGRGAARDPGVPRARGRGGRSRRRGWRA